MLDLGPHFWVNSAMKLKVLMFGWEFPPYNSGGLGTACLGLTRALTSEDAQIIFVLPEKLDVHAKDVDFRFADRKDFKLKAFDSFVTAYITPSGYIKKRSTKKGGYGEDLFKEVLRYAAFAKNLAMKEEFDIIHAHDWLSFKAGIEAKRVSGKPLVVHVHSTEFDRTGGHNINKSIYDWEKEGMEEADCVVAVSEFTKNIIIKHYGIPADKIKVIHNGIDKDDYHLTSFDFAPLSKLKEAGFRIVLFVGRLTIQKGPDYFIKAAKKVLEYDNKVIFLIAGSGDMEHQVITMAASLGISDRVLFAGFLRGEDLMRVYHMADCFVLPSVSEPFGITALEAIIAGTPVIVSKQSGVSEILTHALKVDFWDTQEMASKILAVLNYPSLQLTLRENALSQIRKRTWLEVARKTLVVYKDLLDSYFQKNSLQ